MIRHCVTFVVILSLCLGWFQLVSTGLDWSQFVITGHNLSQLVSSCLIWSGLMPARRNNASSCHSWSSLVSAGLNLSQLVTTCLNLSQLVSAHRAPQSANTKRNHTKRYHKALPQCLSTESTPALKSSSHVVQITHQHNVVTTLSW